MTIDRGPLDELVASYAAEHHCPTVLWGVVRDGALATTGNVRAPGQPDGVDEHTVTRIASMTKSFSAAATLLLRDEGVLRLDDPIAEYDPSLAGRAKRNITLLDGKVAGGEEIAQLETHTAEGA